MTAIESLLDPQQIAALKASATAPATPTKETHMSKPNLTACDCGHVARKKAGFSTLPGTTLAVCSACGRPTETALKTLGHRYAEVLTPEAVAAATPIEPVDLPPVTVINGVEVDLRSEGRFETACLDCKVAISVEIKPEGVSEEVLANTPRHAVCRDCAAERTVGKRGQIVTPKPKTPNKKAAEAKKETPMPELDLTNFSEAQLAALAVQAREHMVAEKAEEVKVKAKKAKKAKKVKAAKDEIAKVAQREERRERKVLPAFEIKGKQVPELDLREQVDLGEMPHAKQRSPYNKALYALGMPLLNAETTTYEVLMSTHADLLAQAEPEAKPEPKAKKGKGKKKGKKAKVQAVVAQIDPAAKAKVEAFATATGKSVEEARAQLVGLGLI